MNEQDIIFRKCTKCKQIKPLIADNFCSDKNRKYGFSYRCKPCDHEYGKEKYKINPRKHKYANMTVQQKKNKLIWANKYAKTKKGRAIRMTKGYAWYDKGKGYHFDLTFKFMEEIFEKPCVYCGESNFLKIGCDRIDNSIGHTQNNVVPCCDECNVARSNHFTHEEMFIIGSAIKIIKNARKSKLYIATG